MARIPKDARSFQRNERLLPQQIIIPSRRSCEEERRNCVTHEGSGLFSRNIQRSTS